MSSDICRSVPPGSNAVMKTATGVCAGRFTTSISARRGATLGFLIWVNTARARLNPELVSRANRPPCVVEWIKRVPE